MTSSVSIGRRALVGAGFSGLLMGSGSAALAADPLVWMVLPEQTGAYGETVSALREGLGNTPLRSLSPAQWPIQTPEDPPALVITLGSAALGLVLARLGADPTWARVPVVAGLLPRASYEAQTQRAASPVTGVWLDPAVERHLDLIRIALPTRQRVGVLWGPSSQRWRVALQRAAQERGLQLVEDELQNAELFPALNQVLDAADVFLTLPDNTLYTPTSLNNMLIAAYRRRVPVLGYAAAHVRAGAVLALHTEPHQVGREVTQLALQALTGRRLPAAGPAKLLTVAVNEQVARSLGLGLPDVARLNQAFQRSEAKP